jgi:hypothetical protein
VHFSLEGVEPFCFAGLWTRWTSPDGDVVPNCTIVACDANALTRPIHDRMPVILADPEAWEWWLDPAVAGEARSRQTCRRSIRAGAGPCALIGRPPGSCATSSGEHLERHGSRRAGLGGLVDAPHAAATERLLSGSPRAQSPRPARA